MILKLLDKPPKNAGKAFLDKTIELPEGEYTGKTKKLHVRLEIKHNDLNQIVALEYSINGKTKTTHCPDGITLIAWHDFEDAVRTAIGPEKKVSLRQVRESQNGGKGVRGVQKEKVAKRTSAKGSVSKPKGERKAKR
jgi:hypothetical protein